MTQPILKPLSSLPLFWLAILLSFCNLSLAQLNLTSLEGSEFLPVEHAYQLSVIELDNEIILSWQIEPGYYLYKHGFKFKADSLEIEPNLLSEGQAKYDEYFGDVTVYYHTADASILKQNTSLKHLAIKFQGCADAGLCYPPRTQYFMNSDDGSWIETESAVMAAKPSAVTETNDTPKSLLLLMLFAFLGGLILNLMPCVLPVLTLKSISFIKSADTKQRIAQGWAYTVGVVTSFIAVATALLALKQFGAAVGWGFQLQSPFVVAFLVYLFFMIGLNLVGAFHLSGPAISSTSDNNSSLKSAFFTGVLACVVASPCTAPFMGTAIGASLTLPALQSLLVFVALGFGMAVPFLAISYIPNLGRWLPKPGNWMNTLKELLAFPMFFTSIWLLWVAASQIGTNGLIWILGVCVLISLIIWWKKSLSLWLGLLLLLVAVAATIPVKNNSTSTSSTGEFSLQQLDQLIATGDPVFLDVTANWCITCKVNERVVLQTDDIKNRFQAANVHYVVADWTNYNSDIATLLARYNRNGIPLYLLFSNGDINNPVILPQILSTNVVIDAISSL